MCKVASGIEVFRGSQKKNFDFSRKPLYTIM